MPDILIRGMEMPKTCGECRFCRPKPPYPCNCYAGDFLIKPSETDMRDGLCPLHELPEHGDLIDRDAFRAENEYYLNREFINPKYEDTLDDLLKDAPVVIPSNKEETK